MKICGLGIVTLSFLAPVVLPAPEAGFKSELERVEALCEAGEFEESLAASEALLRASWLDEWRRELELDGSWLLAPLLDIADPWLDRFDFGGASANERAAAYYARGLVLHRRELELPASAEEAAQAPDETPRASFERAIALAAETGIRADASYNIGTLALLAGEAWRQQIPEISGQAAAPAMGAPHAAGAEEEAPDPLEEARKAYLEAKALLSVRLQLDWRDPDTRANMELVLRRLKELDEIEKQREEQEDEQQDQQDQQDEQKPEDSDQDKDKDQEQDQEQDGEDAEEPQAPEDEEPKDEPEQDEPQEPESEPEPPEPSESEAEPQEQQQEQFLTREEVQRLLDKLKAHEEEGEEQRAKQRRAGRRKTRRDW